MKTLQNKLKLRLEDIEVYKNRIHEQDDEIKKLKSKKEELKGLSDFYDLELSNSGQDIGSIPNTRRFL